MIRKAVVASVVVLFAATIGPANESAAQLSLFCYSSIPITLNPRLLAAVPSWESWVSNESNFSISRIESAVAK
jgi:hypothetical protein